MPGERLVLKTNVVKSAIGELKEKSIHQFFPAYLCLRKLAAKSGQSSGLAPRWREDLGSYLEVAGAPSAKPYLKPFAKGEINSGQEWLNSNLAGSYAGSSLRAGQPSLEVVEYDKEQRAFALKDEHWKLAREHLLFGSKAPLSPLSVFFLRDFAFEVQDPADDDDVIRLFLEEFGYSTDSSDPEVAYLFEVEPLANSDGGWLEPFVLPEGGDSE